VRNEVIRFVETRDAATVARFFNALGLELTVLTRIAAHDKSAKAGRLACFNEMQHACFGQVNAHLHDVSDLFPAHASVSILYHYAEEAKAVSELEQAFSRARKLAMMGQAPAPREVERRAMLLAGDPLLRATLLRVLGDEVLMVEADNGADALDKSEWVEPHLTIAEVEAEDLDVGDFLKKFRKTTQGRESRVLLLTAAGGTPKGVKADAVMRHPVSEDELLQTVLKLIDENPAPDQRKKRRTQSIAPPR